MDYNKTGEFKMKILITGAKGFVGKNLAAELQNIQNGNDHEKRYK